MESDILESVSAIPPWQNCGMPQCDVLTSCGRCNQPVCETNEHKCYYHHNFINTIAKAKPGKTYYYSWEGSKDEILT